MSKYADLQLEQQNCILSGDLHFSNVMMLLKKSIPLIDQCHALTFDFSKVTSSDSSGLALIVEWIKLSKRQNKPVYFKNLSKDLLAIATAANMTQFIHNGS